VAGKSIAAVARPVAGALSEFTACDLAGLIRTRQLTAGEVVEETIRNIEAFNPMLNAVIHKTYDLSSSKTTPRLPAWS
jgi:Asp-tRNA(Asn)/Glu-tRNA(Gln) amidotransferase A subunit family amidase